jgi:hypothetical protein
MRKQHASDSEDEEDVMQDLARQYFSIFIYSISVQIKSMSHHVSNFVCDFQYARPLYVRPLLGWRRKP